ncbi:hypothetical protein Droror1_Dr00009259 [Drosera rotundifolia]
MFLSWDVQLHQDAAHTPAPLRMQPPASRRPILFSPHYLFDSNKLNQLPHSKDFTHCTSSSSVLLGTSQHHPRGLSSFLQNSSRYFPYSSQYSSKGQQSSGRIS